MVAMNLAIACSGGVDREERSHPRIYSSESTRKGLDAKIEGVEWAESVYRRIEAEVDPYVERHREDPEWIVSRLQMYWKSRYERIYVNGAEWMKGEGEAPVPTVRFAGERDWNTEYAAPALEDIQPYAEDDRGIWLQNKRKPGQPWEWAPPQKTGHIVEGINERILALAEKSAFLYWYTGEEKYAKFAADILWTYVEGMYYRSDPIAWENPSEMRHIGLATFEVIHERIVPSIAVCYDYLYDYLVATGRDVKLAQDLFRRWAARIVEGGYPDGNWNMNQARYIVYLALALENDAAYADGRGQEFFIRKFTTEDSKNQRSLKSVVPEMYDPETGVWPEAPGYAFSVTGLVLEMAQVIHNATGQDVLSMFPIIPRAAVVSAQFMYPNGYMAGFGDTYHELPPFQMLELLLAEFARQQEGGHRARQVAQILRRGARLNGYRRDRLDSLMALTSYVDRWPAQPPEKPLQTRTFYADSVNFLVQRNAVDKEHGLMVSLCGTKGGHMHANGMAMELYGEGMVLAPDFGRGPSYWTKSHREFYSRFPAHNTVVVDGISDYDPTTSHPFEIVSMEPQPGAYAALSDSYSFSDTRFVEPKTGALQRRLLGIVRLSGTSGYYVDIFRSRRRDGKDRKNEYLYHNIGQNVALADAEGKALPLRPTRELGHSFGDLKGYDYFTNKFSCAWDHDFSAVFHARLADQTTVCMGMWMKGEPGRTIFSVRSPVARTLQKGSAPKELQDLMVPTVIARQSGPAWKRPFVAVYEPYSGQKGSAIEEIQGLEPANCLGDFVGLVATTKKDGTQYILNDTDCSATNQTGGIVFSGIYGVVSEEPSGNQTLYLGRGRFLGARGLEIDGKGQVVKACLRREGEAYFYSADHPVVLGIEGKKIPVPPAENRRINP